MNSNLEVSLQDKYKFVIANRSTFNNVEHKAILELEPLVANALNSPLSFSRSVQLETFYKCCRPALQSIYWEEEVNYRVPYPVAAIAAFKQSDEKYYAVDVKLASWAESGGVKLMPLKASLTKEKVVELLRCSHALIVPEFEGELQPEFFETIADFTRENSEYPVVALGNSAVILMSILSNSQQLKKLARMDLKFHNFEMSVFASHQDRLFRDLGLKLRLQIENKCKVMSSSVHLPIPVYSVCKSERAELIAVGKGKADDWGAVVVRQGLVHYCFVDPRQSGYNSDHVSFAHKLIVNFLEEVRKRERAIEEKGVELGHYKVVLKEDRFFYNVDVKAPKN